MDVLDQCLAVNRVRATIGERKFHLFQHCIVGYNMYNMFLTMLVALDTVDTSQSVTRWIGCSFEEEQPRGLRACFIPNTETWFTSDVIFTILWGFFCTVLNLIDHRLRGGRMVSSGLIDVLKCDIFTYLRNYMWVVWFLLYCFEPGQQQRGGRMGLALSMSRPEAHGWTWEPGRVVFN